MTRPYFIIIDGAGDYRDHFYVLEVEATDSEDALNIAMSPGMGYGRTDGTAYVVDKTNVHAYLINESTRKMARRVTVDETRA